MSVIVASLQGRFGNQCMQYLFCRALAEQTMSSLLVEPWIGEQVFDIPHAWPINHSAKRINENEAIKWLNEPTSMLRESIEFRGYAQRQSCIIYTKRQAQKWLTIKPGLTEILDAITDKYWNPVVAHRRAGDYYGYGYPVVSAKSYSEAAKYFGFVDPDIISEENPTPHAGLNNELSFLTDFYRLVKARTLLRGNSSFSWLAALLGDGLVLSPIIDGLEGGKEHDVRFVPGNHPRFANLDFVEDLYVSP